MFEYFREIFYKRALIRARRDWNLRNWKVKEILRKDIATGVSASRDVADNCAREKLLFIEQYRMLWMELFSIQLLFGPPFFLFFRLYSSNQWNWCFYRCKSHMYTCRIYFILKVITLIIEKTWMLFVRIGSSWSKGNCIAWNGLNWYRIYNAGRVYRYRYCYRIN